MITAVCFLWRTLGNVPQRYSAAHVNALRNMLERYLCISNRLVCVTDNPSGIDKRIKCVPIDQQLLGMVRYPKLMLFQLNAEELFGGERLMMFDLDVTAVGDLTPLANRTEDFVIWRDPLFGREGYETSHRYNSSLILMNAGCRPQVWTQFDRYYSPDKVKASGLVGSDQAWIGMTLGPDEAVFTQDDGVLGWKHDLGGKATDPQSGQVWPSSARLIVNHGRPKPWELPVGHPLRLAYERNAEEAVAA